MVDFKKDALDEVRKSALPGWVSLALEDADPVAKSSVPTSRALQALGESLLTPQAIARWTQSERQGASQVVKSDRARDILSGVKKGFISETADAGTHPHGLSRAAGNTGNDGPHYHVYRLPSGEYAYTEEDGEHQHAIDGERTGMGGEHSHRVLLGSRMVSTQLDGEHDHSLMVETTGFDGQHVHVLELLDGTRIRSLTSAELAELHEATGPYTAPDASFLMWLMGTGRDTPEEAPVEVTSMDQAMEYVGKARITSLEEPGDWQELKERSQLILALRTHGGVLLHDGQELVAVRKTADLALEVLDSVDGVLTLGAQDSGEMVAVGEAEGEAEIGSVLRIQAGDSLAIVDGDHFEPDSLEAVSAKMAAASEIGRYLGGVDFQGPETPKLVFVASSPNAQEFARGETFVGQDGAVFKSEYLAPLGFGREDVAVGFISPLPGEDPGDWREWAVATAKSYGAPIVAVGKDARETLGKSADFFVPYPRSTHKKGRDQLKRNLKRIQKSLDASETAVDTGKTPGAEIKGTEGRRVAIYKADSEKRIAYGVVLDPHEVDTQGEWAPPADIEQACYSYMETSRVVGIQHLGISYEGVVLENWLERYPTDEDMAKAHRNEPHSVIERPYGNGTIKSGTWMAGIRFGPDVWELIKRNVLGGLSIGGLSAKTEMSSDVMPEVKVIRLEAVDA